MEFLYPFFIAFFLIFVSELGDKTQLLVLSFSSKTRAFSILLGVALGSFFSHGIAILFGSSLANFDNDFIHLILKFTTYLSFIFFGLVSFLQKEEIDSEKKSNLIQKISNLSLNYVFIIAFSIAVGELGDKTFLASLGLGIQYSNVKLALILGSICGMVVSDSIAILLGKWISRKISSKTMNYLSGILFLLFGIMGLISFIIEIGIF